MEVNKNMGVENSKIEVMIEKPLYSRIKYLARKDGVSLSLKVRDLVKEALEIEEDIALARFAEEREESFDRKSALRHKEAILV